MWVVFKIYLVFDGSQKTGLLFSGLTTGVEDCEDLRQAMSKCVFRDSQRLPTFMMMRVRYLGFE